MRLRQALSFVLAACLAGIDAYDSSLPPFPVNYSDRDIRQQRKAGQNLLKGLEEALSSNTTSYVIDEGVYRIDQPLWIQDTTDFVLKFNNAELISETGGNHFQIFNNKNFTLQGPVYLDADPFGFTQGKITDTDFESYIEVQMMKGYPMAIDTQSNRIVFFTPNGTMLPNIQVSVAGISNVSDNVVRIELPSGYWTSNNDTRILQNQIGNLVSIEVDGETTSGGFWIRGNTVRPLLLPGFPPSSAALIIHLTKVQDIPTEQGLIYMDHWYGVRRSGTSRLTAGGQLLVSLQGGAWHMLNSEIGYSFDDLTDVQSGLYYAFNQTSPTEVYMPIIDGRELRVGDTLNFYNVGSYSKDGAAKVAEVLDNPDDRINQNFKQELGDLGLRNESLNLTRVILDREVRLTSMVAIVDIEEYRTRYMVFENCYMHDGLSGGILGKGSQQFIVRNCSVARAMRGIETTVDPYWAEGGIAGNILIQDNTVENCPYGQLTFDPAVATASGNIYSLLAQANHTIFNNVTINNNTILNPSAAGIAVKFASNVNVTGNTIINPVSAVADNSGDTSLPLDSGSGIYLDIVQESVEVSGNLIVGADLQNVPQIIKTSKETDGSIISLCSNAFSSSSSLNLLRRLPNELWTSVLPNSSMVTSTQEFRVESFETGSARVPLPFDVNITDQHAASTFSFKGTGVQFLTCTGPQFGMARIYLDGAIIEDVDASISIPGVRPDATTGFCDQMVFSATSLSNSAHNLTVENLQQEGFESQDGATSVTVGSFAYLAGEDQCGPSPDPESSFNLPETSLRSAYSNWVNYKITGILGPNITNVVFSGAAVDTTADLELQAVTPLAVSPVPVPTLDPIIGTEAPILPPASRLGPPGSAALSQPAFTG